MLILFVCMLFFLSVRVLCFVCFLLGRSQCSSEELGATIIYKAGADDRTSRAVRVFAVTPKETDSKTKTTTLCMCTAGAFPSVESDRLICVKTFERGEGTMS